MIPRFRTRFITIPESDVIPNCEGSDVCDFQEMTRASDQSPSFLKEPTPVQSLGIVEIPLINYVRTELHEYIVDHYTSC